MRGWGPGEGANCHLSLHPESQLGSHQTGPGGRVNCLAVGGPQELLLAGKVLWPEQALWRFLVVSPLLRRTCCLEGHG